MPRKKKETAEVPPEPPKLPAKPRGRPSAFTQAVADEICSRLAKGEPLAQICRDDNMPAVRTVSDWKAAHADFSADFACAREEGFDQIAADCLDIADETSDDTIYGESGARANTEWISRSKLRIETRLKLLAKWDPKRYGDKMQLTGDGGGPLETKSTLDVAGLPTEVLAQIMKAKDAT
jgi:hypothetical protein